MGALFGLGSAFLQAGELAALVVGADHSPQHIEVVARVAGEGEGLARLQAHVVAFDFGDACVVAQAGKTGLGEGDADCFALVAPREVEALVVHGLMHFALGLGVLIQAIGWVNEGVVTLGLACSADVFAVVETPQAWLCLVATAVDVVQHRGGAACILCCVGALVLALGLNRTLSDQAQ